MRWIRGSEREPNTKGREFDPIVEGARHRLAVEQSLAIWERACAEATDSAGEIDLLRAQQRFHEIAARGGRLGPDIGKLSGTAIEFGEYGALPRGELLNGAPGRTTLSTGDAPRRMEVVAGVPGRVTRVEQEVENVKTGLQQSRDVIPPTVAEIPRRQRGFHEFLTLGIKRASQAARALGGTALFQAMLGAGRRDAMRVVAGAGSGAGTDARDLRGQAMWRAGERHAATLYRRARDAGEVDRDDPAVEAALQRCGAGQPLATAVQRTMEAQLGVVLDRVRIHTDRVAADAARAVNAEAFALGEDIFFAEGAYAPETRVGQRLLAHELAHVVQAWQGRTGRGGVSSPDDALEREAEAAAERVDRHEAGGVARRSAWPQGRSGTSISGAPARGEARLPFAGPPRIPGAAPVPGASPGAASAASPAPAPSAAQDPALLRKAAGGAAAARPHMPAIKAGAKRPQPKASAARSASSSDFASSARNATAHSADALKHGLAQATSEPPGKGPLEHGKAARKVSEKAQAAALDQEKTGHRTAAAHAQHKPEAHPEPAPAAQTASGVHGGIKLKPISDWSKFLPEPLPDQDARERARLVRLVRGKIEAERATTAEAYDKLRVAHLQQASELRAGVPKLQAQISATQQAALGHVAAAERTQAAAVAGHIARVQSEVASHAAAEKAKVTSAHAAAVAKINANYTSADKQLTELKKSASKAVDDGENFALVALSFDFMKLRGDFVALGGRKAGDALAVGEDEARGMSGQYDGDKLEAAQKAARDTADGFATQMPDQAMASYADVEANKPDAEQGLHDLATSTRTNVDLIYQNIKKALDSIKSSSIQAADSAKSAAVAEIDQARASTNAGLAAQSASQIAAIHQQASAARAQVTQSGAAGRAATADLAAQSASGLEGGAAGIVHGAARIEAPNLEDVARTVQKSKTDLERGADGLNRSLAQSATDASEGMTSQAAGAADGMASLARTAQAQATQAGAGAKQQMSVMAQGAVQSLGQMAEGSKTTFDKTTADAKTAFQGQCDKLKQAYDTAATNRATSFGTTLSDCASKLDATVPARGGGSGGAGSGKKSEGGESSGGGASSEIPAIQDAAKKAADAVKPWWQKALAVVVAVVVSIAVVVIVTALVATTGPVGMILVGAAAGALSTVLGTMASNLVLGNKLMDGVTWKSVAIGALGGALCAGATAGMGAAAKAIAGSTRIAGSAGTAARAVSVTAKALDSSSGVVGGFRAGAIRYGANLVVNFGGSELATFAVEGKLDLSLQTLLLTVGMAKLPGKLEEFQAKVQTKIQSKIPFGIQIKKTTIGNPAKVGGAGEGGAPSAAAAPSAAHEPAAPHPEGPNAPEAGKPAQAHGPQPAGSEATPAAGAHDPGTAPRTGAADPAPSAGREPANPGAGGKGSEAAPGNKQTGSGGKDRAPGEPGHETAPHESAPNQHGADEPTTGKSGEPAAKPGEPAAKPGEPAAKPGEIGAKPGETKPGETKPGETKPGEAKPGETTAGEAKPGETTHGETPPGETKPGGAAEGTAAHPGEEAAPGGQSGEAPERSGAQEAHEQARDQELNKDGYPEGTRAKAAETAAKVERGEKPGKDGLRDTEGNVRGREELEKTLHDPALTPEERARIEKLLGDELHGKSAPTGRLDRDVEQARAKAKAEAERNKHGDVDRAHPGRTEVRPEPPGRRGALRRALDRANQTRKRVVDTTKHYASKAGELRQIDRRALPATKLRAGIMLSTKAKTVRPIKISDLDVIHPITRDAALAKLETRAAKLREATDRVRAQGGLDEQLLNELIPSNDLIRVVKYRDRYMVFDGNGRLEAIRRAFPDMHDLEITVLEFETRVDLSKLIDKARHSALPPVEGAEHAPRAATPPSERPPGVHEPESGGRTTPPREPTDGGSNPRGPHDDTGRASGASNKPERPATTRDEPGPVRDEPERAPGRDDARPGRDDARPARDERAPGARDDEAPPRARDEEPPRAPREEPERAPEEPSGRTEEPSEDGDGLVDVERDVGPPEPSGGKADGAPPRRHGPEEGEPPHPADMGARDRNPSGEAAHDVPGGIAEPAQIEGFVAEVKAQLFDRWPQMTPEGRANAAADIVNRRLAESGVPATEVHPVKELSATTNGRFNRAKWAIEMPMERFAAGELDAATAKQLASTLAHEANHAEQFFLAARAVAESYRATPTRPARPDAFVEFMQGAPRSMHPGAARAAFETPRLTPGELEAANAMYRDMLSKSGVDARRKIYDEMNAADAAYAKANAAWRANDNPETRAAKSAAAQRAVAAKRAYEQLPEEVAAHKVGGKVKDEFDRTSGTSSAKSSGGSRPRTGKPGVRTGESKPSSTESKRRGESEPSREQPRTRGEELGDDDIPHPADIELEGQPLHDDIDYDQTIRDAVNALPDHLRPSETELAARHDDLVKTLEEWVRSGKPSVETAQRGETAHDRIYADLEDLGRALVGTVRSSGNLARERALAEQTARSQPVRDGVANVMRKIHDKLAADFSANGPFREFAARMRTDVEGLRSRYMHWYAGRDVFGELANPSPGDLDSNIALIHDLEDYFRYENPFDQKFYGDYTPAQRIGTVGEHPDDAASPTTDQPFGDYRHNSTSVKENNAWIQTARAHDAPVWAGPSVTTGRMLTFAKAAGATPEELTTLAWGLWSFWNTSYNTGRSGIHTFHEVMDIARAFGVDYTPFQYPDHPPGTEEP